MMASSSSSSSTNMIPQNKYDVFLSFRGEDTRNNFTGHLYAALCRKQIETFVDDQLNRGDEISPSLLNAIERSSVSIIIFSERYASSGWCLDELVKILDCKKNYGQTVIPVFYRVDPSHVRNQTDAFGDAFSDLEERYKEKFDDKLQKWRIALREAANLSGFDSHVVRSEFVLIEKIVEDILKRLNGMFPNDLNKDLVGVESRIKEIESLLSYGSINVNKLGIWGIGGIGKTTIAGAIFRKISSHFDGSYFIPNVREESEKAGGLTHLRRELLSTLLDDKSLNIGIPRFGFNFESKRLGRKKVLIVFDDVTSFKQIEFFIESFDWFMPGSLIVITTRNKQVLISCGVEKIYKMQELVNADALKLFSRYAFGRDYCNASYVELSNKIIEYARGVPLALKVLGSHLSGRRKEEWESAIEKLKRIPHIDIQEVLKISYNSLDDEEKNIFLDIACFFKGEYIDHVTEFLDACGFSAKIGTSILEDKGLIAISNGFITMHDLLQEMGKEIVRQESVDDPEKRSRLWHPKDICEVLTYHTGTEAIQGICLDMSKVEEISLNFSTLKKMRKLRFLKMYGRNEIDQICEFGGPGYILTKLRYLHWDGCPLKLLPSNIRIENLVVLRLADSKLEQLWDGVQNLVNLKDIDLKDSKQLSKLPDLSKAQNLERLSLEGCISLIETHSSIEYLKKLVVLNLKYCKSLKSLPRSIRSECLKLFSLRECSNLKGFPEISSCNLEQLHLDGTAFQELPSFIEYQSRLDFLSLRDCSRLKSLPCSLWKLKSLKNLILSGCSNLQRLPDGLGNLEALEVLYVEGTAIREVPSSIGRLKNLEALKFSRFSGDHEQMGFILTASLSSCGLHSLGYLSLTDCGITELPESLGQLSSLGELILDKNNFQRIPESIINLSKLWGLYLRHCKRLQFLPNLPSSLTEMDANNCSSLETLSDLSSLFSLPKLLKRFSFINCFKLDGNEIGEIFEDAHQLTQNSWWKEREEDQEHDAIGYISFPGSEVPGWFKHQSVGSSITLELKPDDHPLFNNSKFVGFAFCFIVASEEHHYSDWDFSVQYSLEFKTEDGDWYCGSLHYLSVGRALGDVDSDHVFSGYRLFNGRILYLWDTYAYNNEGLMRFYFNEFDKSMDCCKVVRKCGIRLLYS